MTPWLRTLRVAGPLALLIATGHPPSYAVGHVSYAPGSAPYAAEPTPSATHSADASRAGSLAGEGRARPGRLDPVAPEDLAPEDPDGSDTGDGEPRGTGREPAVPERPEESAAPNPSHNAGHPAQQNVVSPEQSPEPVLRILPLGSGLILMGLGLGLAFVALRVRRH
ncbi:MULTISPECIES: hypothetical protein [Streptomyces]|uniref:hypothetical protein n=1 Tax=Streptomyces TaxID=1883 RepID=UPI000C4092BD|nr:MULTISPECIES: hypothetical protein [Streptomyces]PIB07942.1 hypothetical protein B1C81_18205 [Streptomyces sp. HG99]